MVRLQCPHWALAASAPRLPSPSVHPAVVWRFRRANCDHKFSPRPCVRSLHWRSGLYWGMRASRSRGTPSPVLQMLLAPFGLTGLGLDGALG